MLMAIEEVKKVINNNYTINHEKITKFNEHFIPENYPAICYDPVNNTGELVGMNGFNVDGRFVLSFYFLEKQNKDRDMAFFVKRVDEMMERLGTNTVLNTRFVNLQIRAEYPEAKRRNNNEFIAKFILKGEGDC